MKNLKLLGIILALLFVFAGCVNDDLPFLAVLEITVSADANEVPEGGDVYLNMGNQKTFLVSVTGDEIRSYEWTIVKGNDVVQITDVPGNAAARNVTPQTEGDALVRVKASGDYLWIETEFNIYVNPSGYDEWTFKMSDGSASIYSNDRISIRPGESKNIILTETTDETVTFDLVITDDKGNVTSQPLSGVPISNNTLVINAVKNGGKTRFSITAHKGTEDITKTFIVNVMQPELLFTWNSASFAADYPEITEIPIRQHIYSGYGDINMGGRTTAFPVGTNGIELGSSSTTSFVIGTGNDPDTSVDGTTPISIPTNSGRHLPGQFNLSQGTFRLTVKYDTSSVVYTSGVQLRFSLNNNSDGQANSVLGNNSNFFNAQGADRLLTSTSSSTLPTLGVDVSGTPGTLSVTFKPSERYANIRDKSCLETAFIAFQTWPNNYVTVTGITLEKTGD